METRLDKEQITALIPHEGTAVMIDEAVHDPSKPDEIIVTKTIAPDDIFLEGHFPDNPIYPGHYFDEMMCLAAVVLFLLKTGGKINGLPMVVGKDGVKYKTPVIPGDTLTIQVKLEKNRNNAILVFSGKMYNQHGALVASIEKITGAIVNR